MIYEIDIHSLFLRGYGLKALELGKEYTNPFGEGLITISSYWYCFLDAGGMPFHYPFEFYNGIYDGRVMFGVIHTDKWRKGYLVLESMVEQTVINTYQRVENPLPQDTFDLTGWDDTVIKALNGVYVFPINDHNTNKEGFYHHYDFIFGSYGCEGRFEVAGPTRKPLDQFYLSLLEALAYFIQFYEDPQIQSLANRLDKGKQ
ncbi:MAG: hypothetical protein MUF87_20385 [Anaerolineae bacterium]|jgi:hypothetical protein|nr:hypothetical protein [Anaerolineae bacterium]